MTDTVANFGSFWAVLVSLRDNDKNLRESFAWGMSTNKKMYHKCICSNLNTINLKIFCNHGGIYRLRKKFKKDSGEINLLGVHRNTRGCILEIICEGGL